MAGCAGPTVYVISGTARHFEWRAVDLEHTRRLIDGKPTDTYEFTLVVRETFGVGATFTNLQSDIYQGRWEGHGQSSDRLELPPYCELQIPLSSTGFDAPLWTVTLTGNDESGRPVQIGLNAALPPEPHRQNMADSHISSAVPTGEAQTPSALATLTTSERNRLQILEEGFTPKDFIPFFLSGEERRVATISGATVTFGPRVPQALKRGLRNVAGGLVSGSLRLNSTAVLRLELPAPFLKTQTFRFTYIGRDPHPARCAREILIDLVDADASRTGFSKKRSTSAPHGFIFGSGWPDHERQLVADVLDELPDRWLEMIEGLVFNRDRSRSNKRDFGGYYTTDGHTVTLYDEAFEYSEARFASSDRGAAAIVHEIGHALDFAALRRAGDRYRSAVEAYERTFGRYKLPGSDRYRIPPGYERVWEATNKRIAAETETMLAARSASGSRWRFDPATDRYEVTDDNRSGESENGFRMAAVLDGPVSITKYAAKSWSEYFAEAFSVYVLDPELLELLRPNIYAYFAKAFPR